MNKPRGFPNLVIIFFIGLTAFCKSDLVAAQPQNARSAVDDLFRKAGISKINQGAAADFELRDVSGATVTLSGYQGNLVFSVPRGNAFDGAAVPADRRPGACHASGQ